MLGWPGGRSFEIGQGDVLVLPANILAVPLPDADPVGGSEGPLSELWRDRG
jgi:uncharacterized protein YjlB